MAGVAPSVGSKLDSLAGCSSSAVSAPSKEVHPQEVGELVDVYVKSERDCVSSGFDLDQFPVQWNLSFPKRSFMSEQNYKSFFFPGGAEVKVMKEVVAELEAKGFVIFIDERSQYAAFGHELLKCAVHQVLRSKCGCPRVFSKVGFIHDFTWHFFHPDRPVGADEVVHHEVHRFDNRIKNLTKLTRSQHATHHNEKRQKHGYRKRFESGGLYRPHQPAPVVNRADLKTAYSPPAPTVKVPSFEERLVDVEKQLAARFHGLFKELKHLDSGAPIPRASTRSDWRTPDTRRLGLRMPRLQCTPGEGAVVLAAIKHWHAENLVQAIADELETPVEFINEYWLRVPVSVARERWARHQRLPIVGRKRLRD